MKTYTPIEEFFIRIEEMLFKFKNVEDNLDGGLKNEFINFKNCYENGTY